MATLQTNLTALVEQIGTDIGLVKDDIGAALAAIAALPSVASLINDAAGAGVTDKTWSADKLMSEFAATITRVLMRRSIERNTSPTAPAAWSRRAARAGL